MTPFSDALARTDIGESRPNAATDRRPSLRAVLETIGVLRRTRDPAHHGHASDQTATTTPWILLPKAHAGPGTRTTRTHSIAAQASADDPAGPPTRRVLS